MITIGDYVHLHWDNYLKHGIQTTRPDKENRPNINQILQNNAININRLVSGVKEISNIQQLENEYNKMNRQGLSSFEQILQEAKQGVVDSKQAVKLFLSQVSKTFEDVSDKIIEQLEVEDGLVVYKGSDLSSNRIEYNKYWHKNTQWYRINALKHFTSETIKRVNALNNNDPQKKTFLVTLNQIDDALTELRQINKDYAAAANKVSALLEKSIVVDVINLQKDKARSSNPNLIPPEIGKPIEEAIQSIYGRILTADDINNTLQWRLQEIFGAIGYYNKSQITYDAIKQTLTGLATKSITEPGQTRIKVDVVALQKEAQMAKNNLNAFKIWKMKTQDAEVWLDKMLNTQSQLGVYQKTDVIFGVSDTFGLSVKTTDFSSVAALKAWDSKQDSFFSKASMNKLISLQESSILLYLMGMESQFGNGIANHYLNILAQPSIGKDNTQTSTENIESLKGAKEKAIKLLKRYMIYSAATGLGQLRNTDIYASVLAIYDKDAQGLDKMRLISMRDILIKGSADLSNFIFKPSDFAIENKYVESDDENLTRKGTSSRITNILKDARQAKVAIYVQKHFLKEISYGYLFK